MLLLKKLEQDPDPFAAPELGAEAAAADGETGAPSLPAERIGDLKIDPEQLDSLIGAELHNRDDAVMRVAAVARYLRQREPASPVPYLLLRAFRWGELRDAVDGPAGTTSGISARARFAPRFAGILKLPIGNRFWKPPKRP